EADRARETTSVVDKWKEELIERGNEINEEVVECYEQLNEFSNDASDQLNKCGDELYFWEGILPKMEALVQLDDQLVEDEQIVPPEERGIQHTYEGTIKLRVKTLKYIDEIILSKREKIAEHRDRLDEWLWKIVIENIFIYGDWGI
ncbi:hypothetical protein KI387_042800, partial [Taxus chinensis]